ncbi:hypothetical protein GTO10_02425 [Candidatus Saccharibacteria bacterium]|nr:hypothetical protein [Candidatus Saccharibacteria bacterium]
MAKKKTKKTKKAEEFEQAEEAETKKTKQKQEMEKTIWSVRVGSQTLYKVALDGRTRLDNMSTEENEKVEEVLSKAIGAVAKILKDRTTQHVVRKKEESAVTEASYSAGPISR